MGLLDRIRATMSGGQGPDRAATPPRSAEPVEDWPTAAAEGPALLDPDATFDADTAPAGTLGVLQWTPALLVDDGAGEGFWDYWDLEAWSAGEPPWMLDGLDRDTSESALRQRVAEVLGRPVAMAPSAVVLSHDGHTWRSAPLFVVSPRT
jgi:hypothetical protein